MLYLALFTVSVLAILCCFPGTSAAQKTTRTPIYTKDGTESCLRCHSGEKMRAVVASAHGNQLIQASPAMTHGCESCHGPGSIHISRAHGGRGFPLLTRFGRPNTSSPREEQLYACLSCHAGEGEGQKQIVFIGSFHDRSNINCSTCHTIHIESDPMIDRETQLKTCNRCHRRDISEHPRFEGKSIDFDALSCSTCHDVHSPTGLVE
jgi:DmsE family decaheme c-type cytochrome